MSCAKTAEPIEMQSGMLSWSVRGTCITWGADAYIRKGALLGVSSRLKNIVKYRILGVEYG